MVWQFNVILVMQSCSLMHTHALTVLSFPLPSLQHPCSLVWSGEGSALFVCLQSQIHCITVQEGIPPLAQLSCEAICKAITSEDHIPTLLLPRRVCTIIQPLCHCSELQIQPHNVYTVTRCVIAMARFSAIECVVEGRSTLYMSCGPCFFSQLAALWLKLQCTVSGVSETWHLSSVILDSF